MKHITTASTLLLCAALAASAFVSCSSADTGDVYGNTDTAAGDTAAVTEAVTEEEDFFSARQKVSDGLPEKDFGGKSFRILHHGHVGSFAEQDGDVVNDAIYMRNLTVSERFNVTLENLEQADYATCESFIIQSINAGDDTFDMLNLDSIATGTLALQDYFHNWYDIPYVDFTKPWWAETTRTNLSYDEVCPMAIGDFALMSVGQTVCVYFNTDAAENYDFPDMYELVREGKWTYEKMIALSKDIYEDTNLDGKEDSGDFYGVCIDAKNRVNMFYWAFDNPLMSVTEDGLEITYRTEKMVDFITALITDFESYTGCCYNTDFTDTELPSFYNGNVIFHFGMFRDASWLRDMEDDFGILPLPKWNEEQSNYYTYSSGSAPILAVPNTAADLELIGIVAEALNAESYKQVVPAYYETALKDKYARDEETLEMIDLVMNGRVIDMGFVYDGFEGAGYIPARLVQKKDTNVESYIEKNQKTINARYEEIIAYFTEYHDTH
ncbi:MAG: hypothetical protein IJ449_10440 [Clostridia bacterium]|nr:hypothetical protein [Clostridia bacterium]